MNKIKIAQDNDLFRSTMIPSPRHRVVFTEGVGMASEQDREEIITKVRGFNDWNKGNDPYGEHDFGCVEVRGIKYFFKIDYYEDNWEYGLDKAEGPVNRLLTILRADEY